MKYNASDFRMSPETMSTDFENPENLKNDMRLMREIIDLSIAAGHEILKYFGNGGSHEAKADGTLLTEADLAANRVIVSRLEQLTPEVPILSEEGKLPDFDERSLWRLFWLVDPIDSTTSFVDGTSEFTVNIALIDGKSPIMGVIHQPVGGRTYWARNGVGAFCMDAPGDASRQLRLRDLDGSKHVKVLCSRRRAIRPALQKLERLLNQQGYECTHLNISSSLKFCRVAEGSADLYLGFARTSEWDTGAGQCIVENAGGSVGVWDAGMELPAVEYNKKDLASPQFVACSAALHPVFRGIRSEFWNDSAAAL